MGYHELLPPRNVILNLQAGDREEVLAVLADALAAVDADLRERRDELRAALLERERQGSTASRGVAIPHVKLPRLRRVSLVVAVQPRGVDFHALDAEPVHVFFALVCPAESADEHLALLRWIAEIAEHKDFVPFARQAAGPEQIVELLAELSPA